MITKIYRRIVFLLLFFIAINSTYAQDWPQYLGPNGNSSSTQINILRSWPQQGPEVLWTVNVGIGFGGPVVKDGKVYLLDRDDKVGDKLRCFDLSNGKEIWSFGYDAPGSVMFPGSRSVPVLDGNRIYSCGPYGNLYCVDINTHKPIWNKNVWTDFGGGKVVGIDPLNGKILILELIRSLLFWLTAFFMLNIQPTKEKTAWFV